MADRETQVARPLPLTQLSSCTAFKVLPVSRQDNEKMLDVSGPRPTETEKFSMMGQYGSEADAKMAMAGMTACKG